LRKRVASGLLTRPATGDEGPSTNTVREPDLVDRRLHHHLKKRQRRPFLKVRDP
jgi:hypothetical protein